MTGCLIDLPSAEYEMHLSKSSVKLVRNRKLLHEELFMRPEMQYEAVIKVKEFLEQYKADGATHEKHQPNDAKAAAPSDSPDPPRAA